MHSLDAIVIAGGRGTRLRPLTDTVPKPLVEFCGEPFLLGVVRRLAAVGVDRVLLVVGADTAPFEVLRGPAEALGVAIKMVPEPEPLDTAGGVRAVAPELRGPTLVCNGDILTDLDLGALLAHHTRTEAAATIALHRVQDTSTFGVCVTDGTRITHFVEKPPPGALPGQDAINAGTYVLDPRAMLRFPQTALSFEKQVFPLMLAAGERIEGVVWDGAWADLGTPERLLAGHWLALDGALDWPSVTRVAEVGEGVRLAPSCDVHADARIEGPALLLDGATVGPGAVVGPHVVLGPGSAVGAGCVVERSVLSSGAAVDDGVVVRDAVLGPGARCREPITGSSATVLTAAGSRR